MSKYRVVIMKDGKYLAEDRHGPEECYWTSFDDPFILCFDTPELANKAACNFPGSITSYIDFDNYVLQLHSKLDKAEDAELKKAKWYYKEQGLKLLISLLRMIQRMI